MTRLALATATVADIPVLTICPQEADHAPVVFYVPGYGGGKETGLSLGYRLAARGCCCVAFDPLWHGERCDPRLFDAADPALGGVYPPETGLDIFCTFYQVIAHCLDDVRTLLAHYAGDPRMNVARCAVTGPSMGGYASFLIFANLPQMQAAAPVIAIPTFARRWQDLLDECAFSNPAWAAALSQVQEQTGQRTAFAERMDPAAKLLQAAPRALLIQCGDYDTDQPKHYAIEFLRELQPAYAQAPDKLRLTIYPEKHYVSPAMERDAVEWLCTHLGVNAGQQQ